MGKSFKRKPYIRTPEIIAKQRAAMVGRFRITRGAGFKTVCKARGCKAVFKRVGNSNFYCKNCAPKIKRKLMFAWRLRMKIRVLSHYGKNGKLQCRWRGCPITDVDCLTLDHIKNNGKDHREKGFKTGVAGMSLLLHLGLPSGYQTLCGGHQWKKEIIRRRNIRRK